MAQGPCQDGLQFVSDEIDMMVTSFSLYEKIGGRPPTQTPTQMLRSVVSVFTSQEIVPS